MAENETTFFSYMITRASKTITLYINDIETYEKCKYCPQDSKETDIEKLMKLIEKAFVTWTKEIPEDILDLSDGELIAILFGDKRYVKNFKKEEK